MTFVNSPGSEVAWHALAKRIATRHVRHPTSVGEANMKTRHFALIAAVSGLVLGCKTDPNIPILERELLKQEDEIYKLQDCVEQSKQELESCRRENAAALREKTALSPPATSRPSAAPAGVQPPLIELPPAGTSQMPGSLERSNITHRRPAKPHRPTRRRLHRYRRRPRGLLPETGTLPGPDAVPPRPGTGSGLNMNLETRPPTAPKVDSEFVEQIVLNPILTGPYDSEGMPSDQGLTVLLETRNVRGQLVARHYRLGGGARSVAAWRRGPPGGVGFLPPAEVAGMLAHVSGGEGLYLQMRWPAGPPKHSPLEVYVRLTAANDQEAGNAPLGRHGHVRPVRPAMGG